MEEFKFLTKIRHKNDIFLVLINKMHIKYYLKVIGKNKYTYPTIEEYIELNKIYNGNMQVFHGKICFNPLIRVKNKLLPLSIAASLLLSGCSSVETTIKNLKDNGIYLSDGLIEDDGLYNIDAIDADFSGAGIINDSYLSDFREFPYKKFISPKEFSLNMNLEDVTFEDVKQAILDNENIKTNLKNIFIDGLNNIEESGFNINLGLLYYNIKHLNIIYSVSEDNNAMGAYFDRFNITMTINGNVFGDKDNINDAFKYVILHEILGHGSTLSYCNEDGGMIVGVDEIYLNMDEDGNVLHGMIHFGSAFSEAIADEIACIATKKKLSPYIGYPTFLYYFHNICSSSEINSDEYANYGINYLLSKMIENGISDPQNIILMADVRNSSIQAGEAFDIDYGLGSTLIDYYKEIADKMKLEGKYPEEIKNTIESYMNESENNLEIIEYNGARIVVTDSLVIDINSIIDDIEQYITKNIISNKR